MAGGDRLKRAFDALAAAGGLLALSPVLLGVGLLVKATSRGPVLYAQTRVGRHGRPFRLYKFRTMRVGADRAGLLTPQGDARVTRLGRVLRRTNLDELPQLANVLLGHMSLVGPRPEVPEFVDLGDPLWRKTLSVRPGMTSPVTVELRREGELLARYADAQEGYRREVLPLKLRMNAEYVDGRTFGGDLRIILATLADIAGLGRPRAPGRRGDEPS